MICPGPAGGTRRAWLSALLLALALVTLAVLRPSGAVASVGISLGVTFPTSVTVGQTDVTARLQIRNTSTAPNQSEGLVLNQIVIVPSCGTVMSGACSMPDPGVFSLAPTASGDAGTACAGRSFTVSPPDASQRVFLTAQGGSVVIPPPSSGTNTCDISLLVSVRKQPTIDTDPPTAGVQTRLFTSVTGTSSISGLTVTTRVSTYTTVLRPTRPDANGDGSVTSTDALCILRLLGGFAATAACPNPLPLPDVNLSGAVDSVDALCVLRFLGRFARVANCPYDPPA